MKQAAVFLMALCLALVSFPVSAQEAAGFSSSLSAVEGREGESLELSIEYNGALGEIGVFLVRVDFDPEVFQYQRTKTGPSVRDAYPFLSQQEGWIGAGYVKKQETACLRDPETVFSFRFLVREGAEPGESHFSVSVYQVRTPQSEPLPSMDEVQPYVVLPPPSGEASLLSLVPSEGELDPGFSADCFDYQMTVPFSVTSLTFLAEPAAGGACKVNRKNLGAGGSDTEFLVTVTAEDGKAKSKYRITVHREEKLVSPKPSPTPAPAPVRTASPTTAPSSSFQEDPPVGEERTETFAASPPPEVPAVSKAEAAVPSPAPAEEGDSPWEGEKEKRGTVSPVSNVAFRNGASQKPSLFLVAIPLLLLAFSGRLAKWLAGRFPVGEKEKEEDKTRDPP